MWLDPKHEKADTMARIDDPLMNLSCIKKQSLSEPTRNGCPARNLETPILQSTDQWHDQQISVRSDRSTFLLEGRTDSRQVGNGIDGPPLSGDWG